ncbi:two-component sensor histidine kinase [Planctomycetota bacterium]|nr:two-component sensor histidine kinase [Planctomycetota bacterium]
MADAVVRGRLTIYLGAAPGVGKTFAMLERAQALRRSGLEVLIGVVLTHGREETAALLAGLAVLPPRISTEQGVPLAEFDLAAALSRKPAVVVLDELAHSNAPGSRHAKRWQDAEELLAAGIEVLTTLNVQHIESQREPVARLTGVDVRERVPDLVLERADAIELVDLPSEELIARLHAGKVYLGDGADRALHGFFTPENLVGLRELALRYVTGRVQARRDADGLAPGRSPAERLLVAIGPSPTSARLVRAAKRMADATGATWMAVHAETPASLHLDASARIRVGEHLRLAESLGGQTLTVGGDDAAHALIEAARRHGVRRILVGKPVNGRLWDLWRGSLVHDLVRLSGDVEVLAISGDGGPVPMPEEVGRKNRGVHLGSWLVAVGTIAVVAVLVLPLRQIFDPVVLTLPFLLAIVGVGLFGRHGPVLLATIAGVVVFDLLCVPPYGSLAVGNSQYLLTFLGMLVVGVVIAHLVARLRRQSDQALDEAEGATGLHRLGSALAGTRGIAALIATAAEQTGELLDCRAIVLISEATNPPSPAQEAILHGADGSVAPTDLAVAQWVLRQGQPAGLGTDTLPAASGLHLPLLTAGGPVGVLVLTGIAAPRTRDPAWRRLAEASARLTALAIGCERLHDQAAEARARAADERLRSTILAGVSHDLRTPLTAIAGLAQQLADDPDAERRRTAMTIAEQAERLSTTVRNLLELTRLGSGQMRPRRVALAAEDAIAAAVAAVRPRLGDRTIDIDAADCPALSADESLLHTALVNLIDNAVVHAPGSPITIRAYSDPERAYSGPVRADAGQDRATIITVADRGPGVLPEDRERIFAAWQRGRGATPGGAGLGLALVRAVATAHGGTIAVTDRVGGGAVFVLSLPSHDQAGP